MCEFYYHRKVPGIFDIKPTIRSSGHYQDDNPVGIHKTYLLDGSIDIIDVDTFQIKKDKIHFIRKTILHNDEYHTIGWKKLRDGKIAKLLILGQNNESRSVNNARFAKYRCDSALILEITSTDGLHTFGDGISLYNKNFIYECGEIVKPDKECAIDNTVCRSGIHYFLTPETAIMCPFTKSSNGKSYVVSSSGLLSKEKKSNNVLIERHSNGMIERVHYTLATYDYIDETRNYKS